MFIFLFVDFFYQTVSNIFYEACVKYIFFNISFYFEKDAISVLAEYTGISRVSSCGCDARLCVYMNKTKQRR